MIDWLPSVKLSNEIFYQIPKASKNIEIFYLNEDCLIILKDKDSFQIQFALLSHFSYDLNNKKTYVSIFHGIGVGGNLRVCRHTWWGEDGDGYIFYPDPKLIKFAFQHLSKYFDF